MMEMPDEGSQGGPATATETDGDKGSESVVEGVKDGDEKEEDDNEVTNRRIPKLGLDFES
ncbi:hypothetical protein F2Q68_00004949 [Brassica cretica]|uniref:Uncharacterized protein n=1 Tax=Brassica cretica TaxID=69181 RepID=A0A3N6RG31_BRACR|nr:hypothetical protein F2Q68_00004949 [Brassica cretica]